MTRLLVFVMILVLSGCGSKTEVNGSEASGYFSQFRYKENSPAARSYQYLSATDVFIANNSQGKGVYYTVDLFLLEGSSYRAIYREWTNAGSWKDQTFRHVFQGNWSVRGGTLVVDGLGEGQGLRLNGKETVLFKLSRDFNTSGATQKTTTLHYVISTRSMQQELEGVLRGYIRF